MARTEQQRQRKLAKRKSKQLAKSRALTQHKQKLSSLAGKMEHASAFPVECFISRNLAEFDIGMRTVLVVRNLSSAEVAMVCFLIDTACLGVKDCYGGYYKRTSFDEMFESLAARQPMVECKAETAKKLVEQSIAYAAQFGISPHVDYRKLAPIWGNVESGKSDENFAFGGPDGMPTFVVGPHDNAAFCRSVVNRLEAAVGADGFRYVLAGPLGAMDDLDRYLTDDPQDDESDE